MTISQKIDLIGDIAYQAHSIVSKTLQKNEHLNLTLFAFDAEQALSGHSAPKDAWVQILEGSMEVTIGAELFTVGANHLLQMPAGVPHALKALKPTKMLLTMVAPGNQ